MDQLLALGGLDLSDSSEPLNVAVLALHGSTQVNGMSQLHAAVSQRL